MRSIILSLLIAPIMASSIQAQDSSGTTDTLAFVPDHLRPISSVDTSKKGEVEKAKKPIYYDEKGRKLSKKEMMMKFQKGNPRIKGFVDSSLKIRAMVFIGYQEEKGKKKGMVEKGSGSIPDSFQVGLLNGPSYSFSKRAERDSILVINFWFTACKPCKMEIPELNRMVEHFKGKPVRFLAITHEKAPKLRSFLEERNFDYRHAVDARRLYKDFGVNSFLTHIVLDRQGKVRFFKSGYNRKRVEILKKKIETCLEEDR